jgi:hypothetical protein
LAAGQGEEILRKAVEMALAGNVQLMKYLLDRILPKECPVPLNLPRLDYACHMEFLFPTIAKCLVSSKICPWRRSSVLGKF